MRARLQCMLLAAALMGSWAPQAQSKGFSWGDYANKPEEWFRGEEGRRITANLLSHQSERELAQEFNTAKEPYRGTGRRSRGPSTTAQPSASSGSSPAPIRATGDAPIATPSSRGST